MLVGRRAQVGADPFGDEGQDVGARPAEHPGQQRGAEQSGEIERDEAAVDRLAVLIGNQDVVHQRHGQVGRHQGRRRGAQRQQEAGEQAPAIRVGEAPQAQQRPRRGRRVDLAAAFRAFVLAGHQRRFADRAERLLGGGGFLAGQRAGELPRELVDQAPGGDVAAQRVAPLGQAAVGVAQFERADAGVVVALQRQAGAIGPFLPGVLPGGARQQAAIAHQHEAVGEAQSGVEVDFEVGQDVFVGRELRFDFRAPSVGQRRGEAAGEGRQVRARGGRVVLSVREGGGGGFHCCLRAGSVRGGGAVARKAGARFPVRRAGCPRNVSRAALVDRAGRRPGARPVRCAASTEYTRPAVRPRGAARGAVFDYPSA